MFNRFKLDSSRVSRVQLENARILELQHRALAEEHQALANMYQQRIVRLTPTRQREEAHPRA